MNQQDFATMMGVNLTTVSRWERNRVKPSSLATTRLVQTLKDAHSVVLDSSDVK